MERLRERSRFAEKLSAALRESERMAAVHEESRSREAEQLTEAIRASLAEQSERLGETEASSSGAAPGGRGRASSPSGLGSRASGGRASLAAGPSCAGAAGDREAEARRLEEAQLEAAIAESLRVAEQVRMDRRHDEEAALCGIIDSLREAPPAPPWPLRAARGAAVHAGRDLARSMLEAHFAAGGSLT